jgi:hypothetical protein
MDARTGELRRVRVEQAATGNVTTHRVFAEESGAHVGTLTTAPIENALHILSIENHQRSNFRSIGTMLMATASRMSHEAGLGGRLSLRCMDEGAAKFFYKQGFRFIGENGSQTDAAMAAHLAAPTAPLSDEILFLGPMERQERQPQT